jgi:hypothetical protein
MPPLPPITVHLERSLTHWSQIATAEAERALRGLPPAISFGDFEGDCLRAAVHLLCALARHSQARFRPDPWGSG